MNEKRHIYDYQVLPGSVGSIVPRMIEGGSKVLELGTGPGAITRQLHAKGCRITGLEIDPTAIPLVAPYCERVVQCDLNAPDWASVVANERFDAIVMTDVLEHLYDPWKTLAIAAGLLVEDGCMVVSLPHIGHSAIMASLLGGRFDYQPWGLLDRTHIRFFGIRNMQDLIIGASLKIVDADFVVKLPDQTEFAIHWNKLPEATRKILSASPHSTVYQAVIKAVSKSAPGLAIDLPNVALPAPSSGKFGSNPVSLFFLSHLSLENRRRFSNAMRRLRIIR